MYNHGYERKKEMRLNIMQNAKRTFTDRDYSIKC